MIEQVSPAFITHLSEPMNSSFQATPHSFSSPLQTYLSLGTSPSSHIWAPDLEEEGPSALLSSYI